MAAPRKKSEKPPLSPLDVLNVSGPKKAARSTSLRATAPKAAKAVKTPKTTKTPAVVLEYPQAGEAVRPGHYAVRVAAKPEVSVEISVDGGPWQACREAVGYYWFDWAPSQTGEHKLVARAKNGGPRYATSEERSVVVVETPASN